MDKKQALEYLRNNPVFWSRLGFCYDPPIADEFGKPLVFQPDFTHQLKIHDDFSDAGVKIHTCILHSGWVGIDKYDYSLCDRVLDGIFASGKTEYFIPRIKLNVPVDWCGENPEEICVYENGPRSKEDIFTLVNTEKHDWLGYEAPNGYYNAGGWKDTRPNVGGLISLQSFSSEKWLRDAGEALKRLVLRLENSPYAEKILAYHIAYGACGESMPWGRGSGKFGDFGISNRKNFYNWGIKKYGSPEKLKQAWGDFGEDIVPPSHLREKKALSSNGFYKNDTDDRWSIDYDIFMSEVNVNALSHFGKIVKDNTGDKPVGAFYGYLLMMERSAYAGHLGWEKLLKDENVDFFAAPKSYYRCQPGEPGGEMAPVVSINKNRLWVDECDNRTHLCCGDSIGGVAKTPEETYAVQLRELCKNISHDSGLWYMDLGGGWYDDSGIMSNIASLIKASEKIRRRQHKNSGKITVIADEQSVMKTYPFVTRSTEDFLRELQLCGAPIDIIFSFDVKEHDFSETKMVLVLTPLYMTKKTLEEIKSKIPDGSVVICGKTDEDMGFELFETECDSAPSYGIAVKNEECITEKNGVCICAKNKHRTIMISDISKMKVADLRRLLDSERVQSAAPEECAVYEDNRMISFFPRKDMEFVPNVNPGRYFDIMSGEEYIPGTKIFIKGKLGRAFIKES